MGDPTVKVIVNGVKAEVAVPAPSHMEGQMLDYLQSYLWETLSQDLRRAVNGVWSIAAEGTVTRLVWLIRLRGVTPADQVTMPLLASGVYHAVCKKAGVKAVVDFDLDRYMDSWISTYEQFMKAIPIIEVLEIEEFSE